MRSSVSQVGISIFGLVGILLLFFPHFTDADTVIFTETCASAANTTLPNSTSITVGTDWNARQNLAGTLAGADVILATAPCGGTDVTDAGIAYTTVPDPTTDIYKVDFIWQDAGAVDIDDALGFILNDISPDNYYACALLDDTNIDVRIYKEKPGQASSTLASSDNLTTIASGEVIECKIDYSGTNPTITLRNVTDAQDLLTVTDSSSPLVRFRSAGVMCGSAGDALTNDCDPQLDFDTFNLTEITSAPRVTTSAASGVTSYLATLNGSIDSTNGASSTARGFAWGTNSSLSGGDTATTTESGTFGIEAFSQVVQTLIAGRTYYFRAYATNSSGTGYGSIQNFTASAADATISRKMRLFEGFTVKVIGNTLKLLQS